jgi:hypothetical protein
MKFRGKSAADGKRKAQDVGGEPAYRRFMKKTQALW